MMKRSVNNYEYWVTIIFIVSRMPLKWELKENEEEEEIKMYRLIWEVYWL